MLLLFTVILMTLPAVVLAIHFLSRLRTLGSSEIPQEAAVLPAANVDRYRPMLRLLSSDDLALLAGSPELVSKLRTERIAIFRGYLRCIGKDYSRLLCAIRFTMANSNVDRPDLATALLKHQFSFAYALCRIELSLGLYSLGFGAVDCSGLVNAFDKLGSQALILAPAQSSAN